MEILEKLNELYLKANFSEEHDDTHLIFVKTYLFQDYDTVDKEFTVEVKYSKEYPLIPPELIDRDAVLMSMHSFYGLQCWARFSDIFPQVGLGVVAPSFVEEQIDKLIKAHINREYYTINESPEFTFSFSSRKAVEHSRFFVSCDVLGKVVDLGAKKVIRGMIHYNERTESYWADIQPDSIDIGIPIVFADKPQGKNLFAYYLNVIAIPHFDRHIDEITFFHLLEKMSGLEQNEFYLQNITEEVFVIAIFFNEKLKHHDVVVFRKKGTKLTLLPHARVSSRPVLFIRHEKEALEVRGKKIALVGIGAIGSILGMTLLQSGIDHLYIIDRDYVDLENTTRSIYTEYDIGMLKTDAFKKHASIKDSDFSSRVTKLDKWEDALNYKPDLLVVCIGDLYEEYRISRFIRKNGFERAVFVFGQNDCTWGGIYFQDDPMLGCQQCLFLQQHVDNELKIPYVPYFSEAVGCGNPSYISTPSDIGLIANLAAKLIIERLTKRRGNSPNFYVWQSNPEVSAWKDSHLEQFSLKKYRIKKNDECDC